MGMEVPGCCGSQSERSFHVQKPGRSGVNEIIVEATLSATRRLAGVDSRGESNRPRPEPKQAERSSSSPLQHRGMGGADRERDGKSDGDDGGKREEASP